MRGCRRRFLGNQNSFLSVGDGPDCVISHLQKLIWAFLCFLQRKTHMCILIHFSEDYEDFEFFKYKTLLNNMMQMFNMFSSSFYQCIDTCWQLEERESNAFQIDATLRWWQHKKGTFLMLFPHQPTFHLGCCIKPLKLPHQRWTMINAICAVCVITWFMSDRQLLTVFILPPQLLTGYLAF